MAAAALGPKKNPSSRRRISSRRRWGASRSSRMPCWLEWEPFSRRGSRPVVDGGLRIRRGCLVARKRRLSRGTGRFLSSLGSFSFAADALTLEKGELRAVWGATPSPEGASRPRRVPGARKRTLPQGAGSLRVARGELRVRRNDSRKWQLRGRRSAGACPRSSASLCCIGR